MRLSFRDPDGYIVRSGERIFRCVFPDAAQDVLAFLATPFAVSETVKGTIVTAASVSRGSDDALCFDAPAGSLILEHSPIPFPNFPYEWAPGMLHEAAALTLSLARGASAEGFGLKDATPYNLMFDGHRPVFLDVLSFARRDPRDPIWRPYAQFVRTFLYPLLASRHLGMQLDELLLARRDGLDPERMLRMCSLGLLSRPSFLSAVVMPQLLSRITARTTRGGSYAPVKAHDAREATYLLDRVFTRAERALRRLPLPKPTAGTRYAEDGHNYSAEASARKEIIVRAVLAARQPRRVLDIGCNTGRFSLLAAGLGARVVAIDRDASAVEQLWRAASARNATVLPLVIDIGRPPGASGWANREHPSFLDRARGRFDCVLMLALVHHLIVNERAPLEAIFDLLAGLTTQTAIVEYVDPADTQFQRILRGRDELHRNLTPAAFEAAARLRFRIDECREVTGTRRIYTLTRAEA